MTRQEIANLDRGAKYKIWFHYFVVHLGLKHNFHVRDLTPYWPPNVHPYEQTDKGWGPPDKTIHNIEIRYLWKTLNHVKFDDATDDFLWDWFLKFEKEIEL